MPTGWKGWEQSGQCSKAWAGAGSFPLSVPSALTHLAPCDVQTSIQLPLVLEPNACVRTGASVASASASTAHQLAKRRTDRNRGTVARF